VVVKDKRKIDGGTAKAKSSGQPRSTVDKAAKPGRTEATAMSGDEALVEGPAKDESAADAAARPVDVPVDDVATVEPETVADERPAAAGEEDLAAATETATDPGAATNTDVATDADVAAADVAAVTEVSAESVPLGAELAALRSDLDERTHDLQRVTAEYANYRKRVDRDRGLVAEQAIGVVLATLLPVLDDLDRAREHGDLVGPLAAVAEQLAAAVGKFGLTPFGEKGDPFDPTRHEAVAHQTSPDVTESTCVDVMRRGYLLGDRLLRPALVAVADPE
jgi:molecular chaperone GrpE